MSKLRLTFACGPYDRTLALRDGSIEPEGIELNYIASQPPDIFWRMLQFNEFEVSEMSLSNYVTLVSADKAPFIAIPAFPSRVFRHGYFFINTEKGIKTPADLKGKRLSAAGGVGGFNWLVGREVLRLAGLTADDAQFISQGTAGRLPGFVAGQIDAVALHPEDLHLVQQRKPGAHVLITVSDLWPKYSFNAYGASDALIAKDHDLLRDVIAAMIEANRTIYRDADKAIPAIVEATQKPREAVEFAIGVLTKNCIPSVNTGFVRERTEWTHQNNIDIGDIPADKKLTFDQIANYKLAEEAVASLGGPVTINGCKD